MGFIEYLKKGFEMAKLKGEAADEVAADEGAFIPAIVIFCLPILLVEAVLLPLFALFVLGIFLVVFVGMGMLMGMMGRGAYMMNQ